ncbi:MAG: S-layer homology domain-containing protein [Butyricicoccus sp.]
MSAGTTSTGSAGRTAAREHDISLSFYYPRLNIARGFLQTGGQAVSKRCSQCSAAPAAAFFRLREWECLSGKAALGIVTGYDDGTFRPYQSITRQKAALIPYHTPTASRCAPF